MVFLIPYIHHLPVPPTTIIGQPSAHVHPRPAFSLSPKSFPPHPTMPPKQTYGSEMFIPLKKVGEKLFAPLALAPRGKGKAWACSSCERHLEGWGAKGVSPKVSEEGRSKPRRPTS